jgi:hypothetical protein
VIAAIYARRSKEQDDAEDEQVRQPQVTSAGNIGVRHVSIELFLSQT